MKFAQLTVHGQILQKYDCVIKINNLISIKQDIEKVITILSIT